MTIEDIPVNERMHYNTQKPASVIIWAAVTSCGKKSPLIFIEAGVKKKPHRNLDSLKSSLIKEWNYLDPEMIRACSKNDHKKLKAMVEANGGYIEQK